MAAGHYGTGPNGREDHGGPRRWTGLLTLAALFLIAGAALCAAAASATAVPATARTVGERPPAVAGLPRRPAPTVPPVTPTTPATPPNTTAPAIPSPSPPAAPAPSGPPAAPTAPPGTNVPPVGPPGTDPLTPAQWWDPRDWNIPGVGNPLDVPGLLWDAVGKFLGKLVAQAAQPLLTLLGKTLLHTPDVAANGPLYELWSRNLVLAGSLYGLLILAGGVLVMTHESVQTRYALKDIAPRLVVGLVAAAVSMEVMSRAIGLSNALAEAVLGEGIDGAGVAQQLISPMFNPGNALYLIVMALVALVLLAGLLLGFVIRIMLVMLLAAVAPIALAGHATPATEGMARMWWRAFVGTLVMQVAQSMTLIVGLRVMYARGNTIFGGVPSGDGLPAMLTGIALFWVLLKIPGWVGRPVFAGTPMTSPRPGSGLVARMMRTIASAYVLGRVSDRFGGRGGGGSTRLSTGLGSRLGRHLAGRGPGAGPGGGGPRRRPGGPGTGPGGRGGRPGGGRGGPAGGAGGGGGGRPVGQDPLQPWPWWARGDGRHRRPGPIGPETDPARAPTGRHRLPAGRHQRPGVPGPEKNLAGRPDGRHRRPAPGEHPSTTAPRTLPRPKTPPPGRRPSRPTGSPRPSTPPSATPGTAKRAAAPAQRQVPPRTRRASVPARPDVPARRPDPPRDVAPTSRPARIVEPTHRLSASADVEPPNRPPDSISGRSLPSPRRAPASTRLPLDDSDP
ncbi:hypothetical protein [Embleya sp. NPDC059237]|uniref:hypothetical protein n=1 Tax=Embleya sp. NPDC059237 TaxID=3346784 RepID=UPI0036949D80